MANACFRCKSAIPSRGTFCDDCRQRVSLDLSYTRHSRWWVVVAAAPVLLVSGAAALVLWGAVAGSVPTVVSALGMILGMSLLAAFGCAVYVDAKHVRRRDDTDWTPSLWAYAFLAFASTFLVVPMLPVGAYHLYKRKKEIGLHLERSG